MANEELQRIVEQLETAWNSSDSAGFAAPFAEDADFVHILGGHFTGRTSIERSHRAIFDTIYKGSTVKFEVEKTRFAGSDVAIVFIFSTLKTAAQGLPPQMNARPTDGAAAPGWGLEDRDIPKHPGHSRGGASRQRPDR